MNQTTRLALACLLFSSIRTSTQGSYPPVLPPPGSDTCTHYLAVWSGIAQELSRCACVCVVALCVRASVQGGGRACAARLKINTRHARAHTHTRAHAHTHSYRLAATEPLASCRPAHIVVVKVEESATPPSAVSAAATTTEEALDLRGETELDTFLRWHQRPA